MSPPAVRVRATTCIINNAAKGIEMDDIEARLTDLEMAAEEAKLSKVK